MNRLTATLVVALLVLVCMGQAAHAHDYWNNWTGKPWARGAAGSTYQEWDLTQSPGPNPTAQSNPYGTPLLTTQNGQYPYTVLGPDGGPVPVWNLGYFRLGEDGTLLTIPGAIDLFVPNNPAANALKLIYAQITADQPLLSMTTFPLAYAIGSPAPTVTHSTGGWKTYNWLIEMTPNPNWERLSFVFPTGTNVSQVVVDTICTAVPEPSSLAALGGCSVLAWGLAWRKRRR